METPDFKDILNNDINTIFLNPFEFGETHTVQGREMVIVLDDMENVEREKRMKSHMDGIFNRQFLFYVSAEDFGPMPALGGLITLDGNKYTVTDVTDEAGVYAITVEAGRNRR